MTRRADRIGGLVSGLTLKQEGYDRYVVWTVLALMSAGVVAVYSAVSFLAETKSAGNTELFLMRHLAHLAIALVFAFAFSRADYRKVAGRASLVLFFLLVLLTVVQVYGTLYGGERRWLYIGPIGFQPSELARVALVVHVAQLLSKKQTYIKDLSRSLGPLLIWIVPTVGLIGISDLSSSVLLLGTILAMCFVARVSMWHLGATGLLFAGAAALMLLVSPERLSRIESYVAEVFPWMQVVEEPVDAQGDGYQSHQAKIAVAAGKLFGVGPGKSVQRDFLPAPYNDFIFAIFAEEYGLVGALGLLALFCILLFRGFIRIARDAPDDLGQFLGVGITTMLVLYAFVHAGVATGLLPVTGLPMPFVSYGGTSLVANGALVGILLNISRSSVRRSSR